MCHNDCMGELPIALVNGEDEQEALDYSALVLEAKSKLMLQENCEFELEGGARFYICPFKESDISPKNYWLLVYNRAGMKGVLEWNMQSMDEFTLAGAGFSIDDSQAIATLLGAIVSAP